MALLQTLKSLVNERLSAAAEEIFGTIGQIVTAYEDEAFSLKQEIDRQSRRLDMVLKPYIKLYRTDILHLPLCKEGVYPDQQNMNSSPVHEEPPHIKEEQEELLLRPEEGVTLLAVKSEDDGENRETEPVTITSAEHMKTQAEDCGTPQATADDQLLSSHRSESDTEDSQNMEGHGLSLSKKLTRDLKSPKQMKCHTEKKDFNCKDCGKIFNRKGHLKIHTMIHTGEYPFTCTVCGKHCSQKCDLKVHMRTHTGEKPFSCTHCGKGFINTSQLKTHMMTHASEKPYTCAVCGKGCSQKCHLKRHMMSHTGGKPFTCTLCGKGFIYASNLKTHTMIHTGEKPYTCTVCGKGCIQMCDLKTHMMTHTGEKPFTCTVCGKGCIQISNLKTHMRTHTGGNP